MPGSRPAALSPAATRAVLSLRARASGAMRALYGQRERRPPAPRRRAGGRRHALLLSSSRGRTMSKEKPDQDIREASLEYHRAHPAGKISILPTKQLINQRDLALAYTPG